VAVTPGIDAATAVGLLRRLRHRYTNYFQIAYSWLQVGEPGRAFQYLDDCRERLQGESQLMRHAPPALVLALVETDFELESRGVGLVYRLGALECSGLPLPASFSDLEYTFSISTVLLSLLDTAMQPGEPSRIEVSVVTPQQSSAGVWQLVFAGNITDDGRDRWLSAAHDLHRLASGFDDSECGFDRTPSLEVDGDTWLLRCYVEGARKSVH